MAETAAPMEGGKRSAWMTHVKKTMKANKGKPLSAVLKMAKKTYKKTRRGGGLSPMPLGQEGGRRRRGGQEEEKVEETMEVETPSVVATDMKMSAGKKHRKGRSRSRSRKH